MYNILSPQLDNSEEEFITKKDFWPKNGFRTFPKEYFPTTGIDLGTCSLVIGKHIYTKVRFWSIDSMIPGAATFEFTQDQPHVYHCIHRREFKFDIATSQSSTSPLFPRRNGLFPTLALSPAALGPRDSPQAEDSDGVDLRGTYTPLADGNLFPFFPSSRLIQNVMRYSPHIILFINTPTKMRKYFVPQDPYLCQHQNINNSNNNNNNNNINNIQQNQFYLPYVKLPSPLQPMLSMPSMSSASQIPPLSSMTTGPTGFPPTSLSSITSLLPQSHDTGQSRQQPSCVVIPPLRLMSSEVEGEDGRRGAAPADNRASPEGDKYSSDGGATPVSDRQAGDRSGPLSSAIISTASSALTSTAAGSGHFEKQISPLTLNFNEGLPGGCDAPVCSIANTDVLLHSTAQPQRLPPPPLQLLQTEAEDSAAVAGRERNNIQIKDLLTPPYVIPKCPEPNFGTTPFQRPAGITLPSLSSIFSDDFGSVNDNIINNTSIGFIGNNRNNSNDVSSINKGIMVENNMNTSETDPSTQITECMKSDSANECISKVTTTTKRARNANKNAPEPIFIDYNPQEASPASARNNTHKRGKHSHSHSHSHSHGDAAHRHHHHHHSGGVEATTAAVGTVGTAAAAAVTGEAPKYKRKKLDSEFIFPISGHQRMSRVAIHPHNPSRESSDGSHYCEWDDCTMKFSTVEELTSHLQVSHTSNKGSFSCRWKDCTRQGKPFSNHSGLFRHLRYHTGDKPCRCTLEGCAFTSVDNGELKRHTKLVHHIDIP